MKVNLDLFYLLTKRLNIAYWMSPIWNIQRTPQRRAPGTGWHKRDYIYLNDTDSYSEMGLAASQESSIHDIFRMHEAAVGMISGDLNNDGFPDLVVTHAGGYNSVSPNAENLKVQIQNKVQAVPAPNKLIKAPTNFEPGKTFVYINGGAQEDQSNWIRLRLLDPQSKNRYAVGAKIILNDRIMRRMIIGGAAFSMHTGDLLVGLGKEKLRSLEIFWPAGTHKDSEQIEFDPPIRNQRVFIQQGIGMVKTNIY
ncbi:MAG: hypothetical protein GKR87_08090 [Kiritimatiellae bacterium]|nr:hypothetical protein [Kiritimatiellia bacterium]